MPTALVEARCMSNEANLFLLARSEEAGAAVVLMSFRAPWNGRRVLPRELLAVSPVGVRDFFNSRGLEVLASEARSVWGPTLLLLVGLWRVRRRGS